MARSEKVKELASFIWGVADLLRGDYKQADYGKVILPFTVLRRLDSVLEPTKGKVLEFIENKLPLMNLKNPEPVLNRIAGYSFHNTSKFTFQKLTQDADGVAANLKNFINGFSVNGREIIEYFNFNSHITRLDEANLLYLIVKRFAEIDLHPDTVSNTEMGYIFEELIRKFSELSNETAGEHFTPREVIRLMVNVLFLNDTAMLTTPGIVKTIYDPACGTGGMLSVSEDYIRQLNPQAKPVVFGQELNPESYAICKSDMLIKGQDVSNIKFGNTFTTDGLAEEQFDYMLSNPPFGVEWKKVESHIKKEHKNKGYAGRFGAGLPRISDGSFLFLQHMISKMKPQDGGSRIGIVFNGSPLFSGGAGSGESNIRKWIIENDLLEAIIALPDQLFYNTGIFTYVWILTNRKTPERKGKVQLINAVSFYQKMSRSLGNKRHIICDGDECRPDQIAEITRIYGDFTAGEYCKIFDNDDFGYRRITVERPLRLNFQASEQRIARLDDETAFANLARSKKKGQAAKNEIAGGRQLQDAIKAMLYTLDGDKLYKNRAEFDADLTAAINAANLKLTAPLKKAILNALSERDETADICLDRKGNPEPDTSLRDYENVPLKEDVQTYFEREVLPHVPDLPAPQPRPGQYCVYVLKCVDNSFYIGQTDNFERRLSQHRSGKVSWTAPRLPVEPIHWEIFDSREQAVKREKELKTGYGRKWLKREYSKKRLAVAVRQAGAWIDPGKTKIGYEISFTRYFYRYKPLRPLADIRADILALEAETEGMIHKVLDLESQSLESQSLESQSLESQSLESQS